MLLQIQRVVCYNYPDTNQKEATVDALNMPIAPSATIKHKKAWRACKNFPLNATVVLISAHNPFRPNAQGYNLFELVLRKNLMKPTTVQEIINDAQVIGYDETAVKSKLRWLYTWGDFLEINGQRHFPTQEP